MWAGWALRGPEGASHRGAGLEAAPTPGTVALSLLPPPQSWAREHQQARPWELLRARAALSSRWLLALSAF